MAKPVIAITMGDAAGIGPEIIVKALDDRQVYDICRPLVVGYGGVLQQAIELAGSPLKLRSCETASGARGEYGIIDLLDLKNLDATKITPGQVSAACGKAAMEYIEKAAHLALDKQVGAIATAPINKEAVIAAGYEDTGHMKFLTRITSTTEYAAMLVTGKLRVVHLTDHYSLKEACEMVTRDRILSKLKLTDSSFRQWGFEHPRLGVAALNPHGSDGGLFGNEEATQIMPAVTEARSLGIDASGPFPADSIFHRAINGEFDAVLAMYHDQGHIAIKVHGFEKSVAVTLGLPFVRTSVDHGTAFDIAGKGIADARSMIEAIKTAVSLSEQRL
jgi:4-hydroxythreonine-4-phosphate dehydrogenase